MKFSSHLIDEHDYLFALDCAAFGRLDPPKFPSWRVPSRLAYLVSHSFPFSTNGYAVRTHGVATALAQRGQSVVVVSRPGRPWDLPGFENISFPNHHVIDGVRYLHLERPCTSAMLQEEYLKSSALAIYEILRLFKPSAVMAASNWENATPAIIASRRLKLPFFYEVRGFWEVTHASNLPEYANTAAFRRAVEMETLLAREADHVFTLNDPMRDELVRRGVDRGQISLMPNAHSGAQPSRLQAQAAKARLGSKARHLVGYVGSFSPYEGLEDLVGACARLRAEGLDLDLVLVGSSNSLGVGGDQVQCPASARLRELAASLGIADHLILTGRRPTSELPDLYSAIDLVVIPRRPVAVADLVSPVKPYEAAAYSRPVLLSDVGALKDLGRRLPGSVYFQAGSVPSMCEQIRNILSVPGGPVDRVAMNLEALRQATWVESTAQLAEVLETGRPATHEPAPLVSPSCTPGSQVLMPSVADELVALEAEPTWFELSMTEADYIQLAFDIRYVGIGKAERKKAVLSVEYLDASGQLIEGPYVGFARSALVGWYQYLYPAADATDRRFEVVPCRGTARARIGLRSFSTKGDERVLVSNRIELIWHDNRDNQAAHARASGSPVLACLPFEMAPQPERRKPRVASILDAFSHACFEPECDLVPITPGAWRRELLGSQIDFVLVESAWHGNQDSWLHRVASFAKPPGDEVRDLLRWARKFDVPTVFWNKEDPPNFERFIDRAADFDYIFTTDENCIERYRQKVGGARVVAALPFAAQPKIHNPNLTQPRLDATSFAGTYYADDFELRRRAMDTLLRVSSRYGLDIFDRMHGITGKDRARFAFPSDLQPFIRGSLSYSEMLQAYRRYRVGLNVNSVSDSPTMFSRRVFELLACGTPVVSTESVGVDRIFKGLVPTVESEQEALEALDSLMCDAGRWLQASVRGTRAVFAEHTYGHRLETIARTIGLSSCPPLRREVVALVRPTGDPKRLVRMLIEQIQAPAAIVVIGSFGSDDSVKRFAETLKSANAPVVAIPAPNLPSYLRNRHPSAVVVLIGGGHYGSSYLLDAQIALEGTEPNEASGIDFAHAPVDLSRLTFDEVRSIGMTTASADPGSIALPASSPWLAKALFSFMAERVDDAMPVRSRPPLGFHSETMAASNDYGLQLN